MKCENGHNISITHNEDGTLLTKPSDLINDLRCDTCNNNFTTSNISIKYYLYFPKYCHCSYNNNEQRFYHQIRLYCLNCYMKDSYTQIGWIYTNDETHTMIISDDKAFGWRAWYGENCLACRKKAIYDNEYIACQFQKITIKDLDKDYYDSNEKDIALFEYNP